MRLVGLIVVRAIVIMVPFLTSFALNAVSLLVPVFNLVVCISVVNNVTQLSFIPISAMHLQGSDAACRVPAWALAVVKSLAPPFVSVLESGVLHGRCIQRGLEALDLRINLLTVFRQQGLPVGRCWCAVDLFYLVLNPVKFLVD
jgi:hypothetical protein